jgi:hypothetical protein
MGWRIVAEFQFYPMATSELAIKNEHMTTGTLLMLRYFKCSMMTTLT